MSYLSVLGCEFEKPMSYLKSAPSNLPYCKVWCKNYKSLNLGRKMPYLHIFGLEFVNIIVIFNNQYPRICLVAKFGTKAKILKFGTKNALFRYFWARIKEHCCHI